MSSLDMNECKLSIWSFIITKESNQEGLSYQFVQIRLPYSWLVVLVLYL